MADDGLKGDDIAFSDEGCRLKGNLDLEVKMGEISDFKKLLVGLDGLAAESGFFNDDSGNRRDDRKPGEVGLIGIFDKLCEIFWRADQSGFLSGSLLGGAGFEESGSGGLVAFLGGEFAIA